MKLYLASYRIPNPQALVELLGKSFNKTKVALIPNAKDYYAPRPRAIKIREVTDYFKDLKFRIDIVDLREYKTAAKIKSKLSGYDLVWVMGGNTFILRYEMERSGFAAVIKDLLVSGQMVYGGESAGALVAGNSLKGIESADEPAFAAKTIWQGLSLTKHFVLTHVGSQQFGEAIKKAKELHQGDKTLVELTDTQALVVNGLDTTVVNQKMRS